MNLKTVFFLFANLIFISFRSSEIKLKDEHPLKLYLPDDLQVELWAESPMLYNPTNMDTDSKGRIWVTEAVNYRNFNNDSSSHYHHSKGDRVVILADTDGDGKADNSKVFVQDKDLISPLGIAVFGNEIMVSCAPYLIKYTDTNGDDKPDKKEIFLKGFGGLDHDHSLHSIVGGPDGNWYFNVGNAGPHLITDKSGFTIRSGSIYTGGTPYNTSNKGNQTSDDGKIWVGGIQFKINPDGKNIKVLGHNFRNSYETYVDGMGDMWQNDNDDQVVTCRVSWLAEGGNAGYFSEDGTRFWSADQRPGQNMFKAHWHQEDPAVMPAGDNSGAGSPTGMLRIESDALGSKYKGLVLSADAGRNVIFSYMPKRKSSGYNLTGKRNILISSNPSDNQNYEWNDKRFLEDKSKWFRPSDILIGTDGALYISDWYDAVVGGHQIKDKTGYGRIYRVSPKNKKLSNPDLDLSTQKGLIEAFKNPAVNVRFLAFKALANGQESNVEAVKKLTSDLDPFVQSRALWLLSVLGNKGLNYVFSKLKNGTENEKIVAFRALRSKLGQNELLEIIKSIQNETSPFLNREILVALEKYAYDKKKNLIKILIKKIPESDTYYSNAIDLALGFDKEIFFEENKNWLKSTPKYFPVLFTLHPTKALSYFVAIANAKNLPIEKRNKAVTALAFIKTRKAVTEMIKLQSSDNVAIASLSKYWLAFRSTNDWYDLHDWSINSEELEKQKMLNKMLGIKEKILNEFVAIKDRKNAVKEMAISQIGGQLLIEMLKQNLLSFDLKEVVKEEIYNNPNISVKYQIQKYFDANKIEFSEDNIMSLMGDREKGKNLFIQNCMNCHKVDITGAEIGPDLSHIGQKLDKEGLFEAIAKPNNSVVFGYETHTVNTKDGNSYYGFLISENEKSITLKNITGKKTTINQSQISNIQKETGSIMPSASTLALTDSNFSDLLTYLKSLE